MRLAVHCQMCRVTQVVLVFSVVLSATFLQAQQPDFLIPPAPGPEGMTRQEIPEGELQQAETQLRRFLEQNPGHEDAIIGLATVLVRQHRYQEALDFLLAKMSEYPESMKIALAVGQLYMESDLVCEAVSQFEWISQQDSSYPDLQYWLGSAYLRAGWPLLAYQTLSCCGPVSQPEVAQAQSLVRGSALASLGLQCQASTLFSQVAAETQNQQLGQRAAELRQEMDNALCCPERLFGVIGVSEFNDSNAGVVPTTNLFGSPGMQQRTWGTAVNGLVAYDIARCYNYSLVGGYSFFHTSNYNSSASPFNLVDNALFLAGAKRGMWRELPYQLGLRLDYDYLVVGSDSYLQRVGVAPSFTLQDSDWTSTTVLFRYTLLDFLRQGALDGTVYDADSDDYAVGIFRTRQLICQDITLLGGYLYDRNISQGGNFDYNGHRIQAGLGWLLPVRDMQFNFVGTYYLRDYDNPDAFFGVQRRDNEYTLQALLLYPLRDQWFLTFSWLFDRNDSNLPSGDYKRQVFNVGVQYNFGAQNPLLQGNRVDPTYGRRTTY